MTGSLRPSRAVSFPTDVTRLPCCTEGQRVGLLTAVGAFPELHSWERLKGAGEAANQLRFSGRIQPGSRDTRRRAALRIAAACPRGAPPTHGPEVGRGGST